MGNIVTPGAWNWGPTPEYVSFMAQNTPDNAIVNAGGEVIDRTPEEIAAFIRKGGIWVDYCGWPMSYQGSLQNSLGGTGLQRFLATIGLPGDFVPTVVNQATPHTAPYYYNYGQKIGKGWYFYGYVDEVSPQVYADFIASTLQAEKQRRIITGLAIGGAVATVSILTIVAVARKRRRRLARNIS